MNTLSQFSQRVKKRFLQLNFSRLARFFSAGMFLTFALALVTLTLTSGCGGPKKGGGEGNNSCVPGSLKYLARDNGVFLQWRPNCGSSGASRGYQFYIVPDSELTSDFPNDVTEPHNNAPYPGDTDPDQSFETANLTSLLNGVPYTAVVRNISSDGSESKPSNVIHFTPMPSGEFSLQVRYKGENDGFEFASASPRRADDALNDLYFASSAKGDFLASPSKLSFGLKSTRFQRVGSFKSMLDAAGAEPGGPKSDEVKVAVGDILEALTENNHYVRLRVSAFSGSGKERVVKLEYLYQTTEAVNSF
jgi:hypothetical protein